MKCKTLALSMVMLSCLMALLIGLTSTAHAGQGCGTNWMGDTTGDTDFYVSKNQNQGTSGASVGTSGTGNQAAALGSTVAKAGQMSLIQSLIPNKAGPQAPGTAIVWTASIGNTRDFI